MHYREPQEHEQKCKDQEGLFTYSHRAFATLHQITTATTLAQPTALVQTGFLRWICAPFHDEGHYEPTREKAASPYKNRPL